MNIDELKQNNINNLRSLFRLMGTKKESISNDEKLSLSNSWPNRLWMPYSYDMQDLQRAISLEEKYEKSYIVSLWEYDKELFQQAVKELESKGYRVLFEQVGMYLDLKLADINKDNNLDVQHIKSKEDISTWVNIASKSFGYEIDENVILKIVNDEDIYLLLGYKNGVAVSTALLYENSSVMGVHMVGVPKEHRSQGIAQNMMHEVINLAKQKNVHVMTLQASALGLGIYKRLGFEENFTLRNYQK